MPNPDLNRYSHLLAEYEYLQATEYYRAISPELARKFVDHFEDAVQEIREFPEASPVIHSLGVRRKQVGKFPYFIMYILEPDAIYVAAVRHHRQDNENWVERLREPGRK